MGEDGCARVPYRALPTFFTYLKVYTILYCPEYGLDNANVPLSLEQVAQRHQLRRASLRLALDSKWSDYNSVSSGSSTERVRRIV